MPPLSLSSLSSVVDLCEPEAIIQGLRQAVRAPICPPDMVDADLDEELCLRPYAMVNVDLAAGVSREGANPRGRSIAVKRLEAVSQPSGVK